LSGQRKHELWANYDYSLEASGASCELHHCGRSENRLAFVKELKCFAGDKVHLHLHLHLDSGPASQALDINTLLQRRAKDWHLYLCGPNGFMEFITDAATANGWEPRCIRLERFGVEVDNDGVAFTVVALNRAYSVRLRVGRR